MAKLIDADAFIAEHCADCKYYKVNGLCTKEDPVCGSVQIVTELPTIDAVEVVRCKDCKHYKTITCSCSCTCVTENWYCADGERKDNE